MQQKNHCFFAIAYYLCESTHFFNWMAEKQAETPCFFRVRPRSGPSIFITQLFYSQRAFSFLCDFVA
ncbi:hypothetical protein EIO60_01169|nr:hypothetical protein [Candidatus Pantoea persica]